jgi:hypothetical protein
MVNWTKKDGQTSDPAEVIPTGISQEIFNNIQALRTKRTATTKNLSST